MAIRISDVVERFKSSVTVDGTILYGNYELIGSGGVSLSVDENNKKIYIATSESGGSGQPVVTGLNPSISTFNQVFVFTNTNDIVVA